MKYLSKEWFDAANKASKDLKPILNASIEVTINKDEKEIIYYVLLGPDNISYSQTNPNNIKMSFYTDWQTSTDIAKGELSSQKAFLENNLTISGETNLLNEYNKQLTQISDCLNELREITIWQ